MNEIKKALESLLSIGWLERKRKRTMRRRRLSRRFRSMFETDRLCWIAESLTRIPPCKATQSSI